MQKERVDDFYPISQTIVQGQSIMWQLGFLVKINDHLAAAKRGDRERESKLINRLGQLRRSTSSLDVLNDDLKDAVKEAVTWLRSTGRSVNFGHDNPGMWVTLRDGRSPRF